MVVYEEHRCCGCGKVVMVRNDEPVIGRAPVITHVLCDECAKRGVGK